MRSANWLFCVLLSLLPISGCGSNQIIFSADTHRALVVKNTSNGQVVCLVKSKSKTKNDNKALLGEVLNDLCQSYQNGTISMEQYRTGIAAATPLLLASKVGSYILASKNAVDKNLYGKVVGLIKPIDGIKTLCHGVIAKADEYQPIVRLCIEAVGI